MLLLPALLASAAPQVPLEARAGTVFNIHPNGDNSKCIGVLGGKYIDGAAVDIFDCNGSATQRWSRQDALIMSKDPVTGSELCFDVKDGLLSSGTPLIIRSCNTNQGPGSQSKQNFSPGPPATFLQNFSQEASNGPMCGDLTDGIKTNRNPLQIWACSPGNPNQVWTYSEV